MTTDELLGEKNTDEQAEEKKTKSTAQKPQTPPDPGDDMRKMFRGTLKLTFPMPART